MHSKASKTASTSSTSLQETSLETDKVCAAAPQYSLDARGAYIDMGGKQPLFCPLAEMSICKLQKVRFSLALLQYQPLYGQKYTCLHLGCSNDALVRALTSYQMQGTDW